MHSKHFSDYIDPKYIWVHGSISLGSSVFAEIPFFGIFSLTQRKEKVWLGGTQAMLLPELSCVYISSFRSVAPWVFLAKITFLAFSRYHGNYFLKFLPMF